MHYWTYGDGGWLGGLFMLIAIVVFLGGLITVGIVLLRRFGQPPSRRSDALKILDERFARGEIDKEEYEQRRATLGD
ncbi:SHOCT domain-containing protein [Amycolatopsis sp. NPDC059027]|uniref:SHOCT domain-containing protein n=1 Tax=unclassified Amycolatopsis TaxID=2618356 RepID=UPI00366A8F07